MTTESGLFAQIEPAFGRLLEEHVFDKVEESYDRKHFGNAILTFNSSDFALSFVRDRSQLFVNIGRLDVGRWHKLESVLEFVTGEPVCLSGIPPLDRLAEAVNSHYENLKFLFEEQRYATTTRRMLENFVDSQTAAWIRQMPNVEK